MACKYLHPFCQLPFIFLFPLLCVEAVQKFDVVPLVYFGYCLCALVLYCTTVLFKVLYCKIKNVFFIFCVCLFVMLYLCEKYYKPITVQYYIANCVSWVPRLTLLDLTNKLDLRTRSQNRTCSYVGDLLYRYHIQIN